MLKWLHRGFVVVLLVVAVGAGVFQILGVDNHHIGHEFELRPIGIHAILFRGGVEFKVIRVSSSNPGLRMQSHKYWGFSIHRSDHPTAMITSGTFKSDWFLRSICRGSNVSVTILTLRFWLITILAAAYPCFFLYRTYRRRRGRPANACPHCSYDLTGNESGTCPECGERCGETASRAGKRKGLADSE